MNKDINLRDTIIFGEYNPAQYSGGIKHFSKINLSTLEKLMNLDFIDMNECQNNSPTTQEIYMFVKKYPQYYVHGYVVDITRSDYRITLEGVMKDSEFESQEEQYQFIQLFGDADELDLMTPFCWYD